jgi:hypothetical protein
MISIECHADQSSGTAPPGADDQHAHHQRKSYTAAQTDSINKYQYFVSHYLTYYGHFCQGNKLSGSASFLTIITTLKNYFCRLESKLMKCRLLAEYPKHFINIYFTGYLKTLAIINRCPFCTFTLTLWFSTTFRDDFRLSQIIMFS